jgi:hypothetical protein
MARVSFTVRSTTAASGGSFLRVQRPAGTDEDSALRQDRLVLAPQTFEAQAAYLDAELVEYGEVILTWGGLPILSALTSDPSITTTLLVYSELGPPQTLAQGVILAEISIVAITTDVFSVTHTTETRPLGVHPGHWAYYSLFGRFQSTSGDDYYERLASIEVLPPINYGSIDLLWQRIPPFYREQDLTVEDYMKQFLSVFGFDMDRIRTLLDYLMTAKDPAIADVAALAALAQQMASMLLSTDLGTIRLRKLMNDIGYFQRSKGTPDSLEFWAKSLTNGNVLIDQDDHTVTVMSQRVNYIINPKTGIGIRLVRAADVPEANITNAVPFSPNAFGTAHPYAPSGSVFGASPGIQYAMVHFTDIVPVHLGDHVALSIQSGIGTDALVWARVVDAAGVTMGIEYATSIANGFKAADVNIIGGSATVYTNAYVECLVQIGGSPPLDMRNILVEVNNLGPYFDGSTVRGGWLVDQFASVGDYRWESAPNASRSLYAEEYERTKGIVDALLFNAFPINEAAKYTIKSYDGVPGITNSDGLIWDIGHWDQGVWT